MKEVRISLDQGIAGHVAITGECQNKSNMRSEGRHRKR